MLSDFFAIKLGMTQAWTTEGKRVAVTRCKAAPNKLISSQLTSVLDKTARGRSFSDVTIFEVGFGQKKIKNVKKPLRSKLEKSGFSEGVAKVSGVRVADGAENLSVGSLVPVESVLAVGDVVQVQGVTKGRGFAGAVKRYGFAGGPKTHGQSDRHRAVGSIGAGTTPGRVWKGKRMPGHYGVETKTVTGLVVVHIDPVAQEIWLSGPIPGSVTSAVRIRKTGEKKSYTLNQVASQVAVVASPEEPAKETENTTETPTDAVQTTESQQ